MPKVGRDKDYTQKTVYFMRWLKGAMAMEDVSQADLAEYLGITQQTLSYHIRNHKPFDYPQLVGIFSYLNVPDDQIANLLKQRR